VFAFHDDDEIGPKMLRPPRQEDWPHAGRPL